MSELFFWAIQAVSFLFLLLLIFKYRQLNKLGEKLSLLQEQLEKGSAASERNIRDEFSRNRNELVTSLKLMTDTLHNTITKIADLQFSNQSQSGKIIESRLEKMRETMESGLKEMQRENAGKLEEMRLTVNEKLHETLEKRLSESFRQVSERLEMVHKGLGEMQTLANGVGDLKKILSNVKTRGIFGELQLGNILEQILTNDQYERNVVTKKGSRDNVEFAIRLPGREGNGRHIYLPLDSKFPLDDYYIMTDAYERGDNVLFNEASKNLESNIKRFARDIRDKYLDPPNTTDFGIMFLPLEGLYAEIARRSNLIEILQREYKIILTGPTTLAAILNSLQMGFKTLAIEKRSSEVWGILAAVKTEFAKFGDVLRKAQEKIIKASEDIDELVGARTRKIQMKLKNVEELPEADAANLLTIVNDLEENDDQARSISG